MPELADELDPYRCETPYDVLGVPPEASAVEIRNKYNSLKRDLQESGLDAREHGQKKERIEAAYNQLRTPAQRVRIDFKFLDRSLGSRQCEAIAKTLEKPNTDVGKLIKPRRIRVTHEALLGDLQTFFADPPRPVGLHPRSIELCDPVPLPEPLEVRFDC
jgi:curved DNA-binding protein CbpA